MIENSATQMKQETSNKQLKTISNLELGIVFCLSLFYQGIKLPPLISSVLVLLSFIVISALIIRQWRSFIYVATRDLILLLTVGIALISVVWSTNPGETLASSRAILSSTAFGIYLATRYTPKEQLSLLAYFFGIYTILNFLIALLLPSYGMPFRTEDGGGVVLQGFTGHKNQLAAAMAMATTLFLDISVYGQKYRRAASVGAMVTFIALLLSKGKGSLGIFIGLLCLMPLYKVAKIDYRLKTFFGICAFLISAVIIIITLINLEYIVVDFLGKDMNFSGRIPLWNYLIQRGMEKPWLGYGYGAFWADPAERLGVELNTWIEAVGSSGNSHNAYVELFLQLGFLGMALVILSFVTVLIRVLSLLALTKQIEYFWMLQFLLFIAISSYSEVFIGLLVSYRSLYWVLYVSICCSTAIHLKRIVKTKNKLVNLQYENITYQRQRS